MRSILCIAMVILAFAIAAATAQGPGKCGGSCQVAEECPSNCYCSDHICKGDAPPPPPKCGGACQVEEECHTNDGGCACFNGWCSSNAPPPDPPGTPHNLTAAVCDGFYGNGQRKCKYSIAIGYKCEPGGGGHGGGGGFGRHSHVYTCPAKNAVLLKAYNTSDCGGAAFESLTFDSRVFYPTGNNTSFNIVCN
jgi:hypothetical protein